MAPIHVFSYLQDGIFLFARCDYLLKSKHGQNTFSDVFGSYIMRVLMFCLNQNRCNLVHPLDLEGRLQFVDFILFRIAGGAIHRRHLLPCSRECLFAVAVTSLCRGLLPRAFGSFLASAATFLRCPPTCPRL
jgi:hypothetical protein